MTHDANKVVVEAAGRWLDVKNLRRVARLGTVGRSTLYGWLDGVHPLPVYALRLLYPVVPNVRAVSEVLGLRELGLQLMSSARPSRVGDVRDEVLDVGVALGRAQARLVRALRDGKVTEAERREIRADFDDIVRQVEQAKEALDAPALKAVPR